MAPFGGGPDETRSTTEQEEIILGPGWSVFVPKAWGAVPAPNLMGLLNFASEDRHRRTTPSPYAWLVGEEMLIALIRSPKPNREYHLGMFDQVRAKASDADDRPDGQEPFAKVMRRSDDTGAGVGAFLDKAPMDYQTARHEIGHFLGLRGHKHGGIMSYGKGKRYESLEFLKTFCGPIHAWIAPWFA